MIQARLARAEASVKILQTIVEPEEKVEGAADDKPAPPPQDPAPVAPRDDADETQGSDELQPQAPPEKASDAADKSRQPLWNPSIPQNTA
jgi:hypothetical protein